MKYLETRGNGIIKWESAFRKAVWHIIVIWYLHVVCGPNKTHAVFENGINAALSGVS